MANTALTLYVIDRWTGEVLAEDHTSNTLDSLFQARLEGKA